MNTELPKQRILIVDDTPANIKMLGQDLIDDYIVTFATNGEDALDIAMSEKPPRLILLDILLPGINGYEVCRRLKADKRTAWIPIIFITALRDEADRSRGLELGAVDYITKPFNLSLVKSRIKTQMDLLGYQRQLSNLSHVDRLTGLSNRGRFDEILDREWRRSMRGSRPLSLIMANVDFFRSFSHGKGPGVGDECLRRIAGSLIASSRRAADFVSRYSPETFAVILPETKIDGAVYVAEMIRGQIEKLEIPHPESTASPYVTISLGCATIIPERDFSPAVLIEAADRVLNEAKEGGRNRVKSLDLN